MSKKNKRQIVINILIVVTLTAFIATVVFIIWIILNNQEQPNVSINSIEKSDFIVCDTNRSENAFFNNDHAISARHEIKVTFNESKINKVFYAYAGEYETERDAEAASNKMHADYNIYLGENKTPLSVLSSNFSNIDRTVRIDLYGSSTDVNAVTSRFFFLDENKINELDSYSEKDLERFYKNQGFNCESRN